jgi:diadenosine tetraphosphate (Ap4A) HIT family hydrolase
MTHECLFCHRERLELVAENELSYAIRDKYPATPLHTLIISKQHYKTVFDLPDHELVSIFALAKVCREQILKEDALVKGFNFGANSGEVAGQKIQHVHFHLIPRRVGDIEPPPAH